MTDRRRKHPVRRAWRATFGRLCPLHRSLRARRAWAWWTATGVIPRWQLLLVYALIVGAFVWSSAETRTVATDAKDASKQATHASEQATHAVAENKRVALLAKRAADDAKHAVEQVQASRIELCRQANRRHDNVIAELDKQIARLPPGRRARAEAGRDGTVALLEAISPRRKCVKALGPTP